MSEEQQENGSSSADVPEIELIIKVNLAFFSNYSSSAEVKKNFFSKKLFNCSLDSSKN